MRNFWVATALCLLAAGARGQTLADVRVQVASAGGDVTAFIVRDGGNTLIRLPVVLSQQDLAAGRSSGVVVLPFNVANGQLTVGPVPIPLPPPPPPPPPDPIPPPPPPPPPPVGILKAFPGAEGFGTETKAGRGGRVLFVTTLADSGPGSLRAALATDGPRTIIFRTGGTIELDSELVLSKPFCTIAGQTAPGGGICLKNRNNKKSALRVSTKDWVLRHIRSRPGAPPAGYYSDGISLVAGCERGVIDHCDFSWATRDNVIVWYAVKDVTISWSIISECLYRSTHPEGPHSMGMLLGSEGAERISVHHNLFAHNDQRNPRVKTTGVVDVVGNVIYNPTFNGGWGPSHITDESVPSGQKLPINYVANFFQPGPESGTAAYLVSASSGSARASIFLQGNITPWRKTDGLDEAAGVIHPSEMGLVTKTRHPAAPVTIMTAQQAFEAVLAGAGATKPQRDRVSQRIVADAKNRTGKKIDDPSQVGGWPVLAAGTPPADADNDGMADSWELARGLNPRDPADNSAVTASGYTNLELYLDELAR